MKGARRQQREAELIARKDKALAEKLLEENGALINENSTLTAKLQLTNNSLLTVRKKLWKEGTVFPFFAD